MQYIICSFGIGRRSFKDNCTYDHFKMRQNRSDFYSVLS